jgi:hypothetical protein
MAHSLRINHYSTLAAAVVFFTLAGLAQAKPADPAADPYDAARDAEAQLNYKQVVIQANRALEGANSHERLVNLYRMLGTANGVLGKGDDAVDAFTKLLAIDPDHHLPRGTSPKITAPFREAGGYWVDRPKGLQVLPTLPPEMASGKPLNIPVKLDDPLQLAANVRLSYRLQGEVEWKTLTSPAGPNVAFLVPADQIAARPTDYNVELYFIALGASGSELRLAGDPAAPLTVKVAGVHSNDTVVVTTTNGGTTTTTTTTEKKPNPILKKWWLWTAVGAVVVVGVGLGAGLGWYYSRDTSHVDFSITSKTGP